MGRQNVRSAVVAERPQSCHLFDTAVFTDVATKTDAAAPAKAASPLDIIIFSGVCAIAIGWLLIAIMVSFVIGGIVVLAGLAAIFFGVAGKLAVSLLRRRTTRSSL